MQRLLVLFHDPHHLHSADAQAWLEREVADILERAEIRRARLTRLGGALSQSGGGFDWLLELRVAPELGSNPRSIVAEMVADLRLLGMAPTVALADDRNSVELGST